jgi:hypothetical protein
LAIQSKKFFLAAERIPLRLAEIIFISSTLYQILNFGEWRGQEGYRGRLQ